MPKLGNDHRQDCCRRVVESSAPRPAYYVLIVLSTLIASYGLLSNSTATVIGAMIVAPLMGPILGIALGTVMAHSRMFRRSFIAESTGVVLVVLTGMFVAAVAGPEYIDFMSSEIAGRTRPTLFDFAIGLAAGLAGAYCTVHPGLQASVAGVAIAVALVPPLAVTGIAGAGWVSGEVSFSPVFGSFMLFFTNLLTIELAAAIVFLGTGFRESQANPKALWTRTLIVKGILLLFTGIFLTSQLTKLIQERVGLSTSTKELRRLLTQIPGANLDTIEAHLKNGQLVVTAVVGSRVNIVPAMVERFETQLNRALGERLSGVDVRLVVRTVNSTYASSTGYLFEPTKVGLDDEERRMQSLEVTLRESLSGFPGVDFVDFHLASDEGLNSPLVLTLSSPYDFDPRMVRDLERKLNDDLFKDSLFSGYTYKLLVRTIIIRNATSEDAIAVQPPEMRTSEEREVAERELVLRQELTLALEASGDLTVLELHLRHSEPRPTIDASELDFPVQEVPDKNFDAYTVRLEMRSPKLVGAKILSLARKEAEEAYAKETGRLLELSLDSTTTVGNYLFLDQASIEEQEAETTLEERLNQELNQTLASYVTAIPGATLTGITGLQRLGESEDYRLYAVVTSPKPLEKKIVLGWQKQLLKLKPDFKSLELQVENRLGRTVKLKPSLRKPAPNPTP